MFDWRLSTMISVDKTKTDLLPDHANPHHNDREHATDTGQRNRIVHYSLWMSYGPECIHIGKLLRQDEYRGGKNSCTAEIHFHENLTADFRRLEHGLAKLPSILVACYKMSNN